MFEKLFKYPRVLARHRDGPLAKDRERYLVHRCEQDTAPATLVRIARELRLEPGSAISLADVWTAAGRWARAAVDINTIRAWLGHSSLDTTNVYAEIDLEMKAQALALCEVGQEHQIGNAWSKDRSLMEFLRSL